MSEQKMRFVNVIPNVKIKQELLSDDEEDIMCRICNKSFANETALRNHARVEHIEAYINGDSSLWTKMKERQVQKKEMPKECSIITADKKVIKLKTEQLISSLEPTDIMSLANEDVSYIIIKSETMDKSPKERRRKVEKPEGDKLRPRDVRQPQPITGPFECLQPSNLVADGTCHQIFFSCCEYSIHFRDEHTRRRRGLRCQVCEKPLLGNGEEPTAPYTCEVCGQGFQVNKELSQHMATDHVKLKPFECSVCHKRFTQQGGVQQHMRMHTGDRPFNCTFCPKAFTQKSGLDQHIRIHTKVKPYRCVVCSKTFCQSVHLKQHMRTHTNVAPFQCGICQKRFKQSSHLNYHLKNHNPLNMSEEQKTVYKHLISLMNEDGKRSVVKSASGETGESGEAGGDEVVCYSDVEMIEDDGQTVEEGEVFLEQEQIEEDNEQILAEQSIQIEGEGGETYILGDNGNEVWSVQLRTE